MIRIEHVTKTFETYKQPITALDDISLTIPDGSIFGLIGSNGAGKSTLFRLLAGVYKPDKGELFLDGEKIFNNPHTKEHILFIPDDFYYLSTGSLDKMAKLYRSFYKRFDTDRYEDLKKKLDLDGKASLSSLSKGTRRRAIIALGLSTMPRMLLLDETFDGLDPMMRGALRNLLYADVLERRSTVLIATHSIRELEDTCDRMAMIHKGKVILDSDTYGAAEGYVKIQFARSAPYDSTLFEELSPLRFTQSGSVCTFMAKGDKNGLEAMLSALDPMLLEIVPMNLEEVFLCKMEELGYTAAL